MKARKTSFINLMEVLGALVNPKGMTDEDINTIVTSTAPAAIHTGPITRARARQLNYQVLMRTSIQLLHPQPLLLYILDQLLELVHAN